MTLKVKKLDPTAILPTRGTEEAAGWDLYALLDEFIPGNTTGKIRTGIAIEIPEGYFGAIYARSGLSIKEGLRPANCVGVIDSDYRGEVIVALHNDNLKVKADLPEGHSTDGLFNTTKYINKGDRIAQLVIQKYEQVEIVEVDELSQTDRGAGGFGSTGKN